MGRTLGGGRGADRGAPRPPAARRTSPSATTPSSTRPFERELAAGARDRGGARRDLAADRASRRAARTSGSASRCGVTGLLDRFTDEQIFSASDVEHGKPAPDLFLHAAASDGLRAGATAWSWRTPPPASRPHARPAWPCSATRADGASSDGARDVFVDGRAARRCSTVPLPDQPQPGEREQVVDLVDRLCSTGRPRGPGRRWRSRAPAPTSSCSRSRMPSTMPA